MLVYFWPFGQFSCHLEYFMALWYILWSFGIFSPVLVHFTTKKSGTLAEKTFEEKMDKKFNSVHFMHLTWHSWHPVA
jgi:hypothetical protein